MKKLCIKLFNSDYNTSSTLLQEEVGTQDSDFALGHHVAAHYLLQDYLSNLIKKLDYILVHQVNELIDQKRWMKKILEITAL